MSKILHKLILILLVSILTAGLTACQDEPGPAEKAGQQLDEAMQETGDSIEGLGEDIKNAAE
ncbi:hypothetical protein VRRI112168_17265 [Vreelandella rituensis]|uniref:Lipoprotein n=1 Tax=Vreelandella rituensis TaxID=2282306 RepID=A0A368TSQ5_9GAMM|nr:hypothetical protein [Halomonas rituensis]RCV86233.1 hypothetical protein DU506_18720 [Halomonas rituensis]